MYNLLFRLEYCMNTVKLEYCMNTVRVAPVEVFLPLLWRDTFLWNNPSCCEGAVRKRVDGGQRTVPRAGHCGPVPVVPPNPTQPTRYICATHMLKGHDLRCCLDINGKKVTFVLICPTVAYFSDMEGNTYWGSSIFQIKWWDEMNGKTSLMWPWSGGTGTMDYCAGLHLS